MGTRGDDVSALMQHTSQSSHPDASACGGLRGCSCWHRFVLLYGVLPFEHAKSAVELNDAIVNEE